MKAASIAGLLMLCGMDTTHAQTDWPSKPVHIVLLASPELDQWYAHEKIKPVIDRTMPMAELKAAYAHMSSRGVKGKLVMVN